MGKTMQVITGQATNPGVGPALLTPNVGDSFTVKNPNAGAPINLIDAWCFTNTNLLLRIRSPLMHDQAQNMRIQPVAAKAYPLMNGFGNQVLYPQDTPIVELSGGAAEVDAASLLVYYDDLAGASPRLFDWTDIAGNIAQLFTVEVDVVSSATPCNYSPSVAMNASFDTFKRDRDYAVLGYTCATEGLTVGITGPDTSNYRVGAPLTNALWLTRDWFVRLNQRLSKPTIPVINSANIAATMVDIAAQGASATYKIGFHLALLSNTLAGH